MRIKVNKHNIEINKEELINEKEVNVSKCYFEFSEDYTDSMVKKALFTKDNKTYEMLINNNECDYPSEILESEGTCVLGVYAYTTENEFTRFNPTPQKFAIEVGSLRPSESSQPITPSEMEQYQQALQNGLNEVNKELEEVLQIGNEVAKQGEYATEQGNYAKSVGEQLEKDKENGLFKGEKGEPGKDGKDFTYEDFTKEQLENLRGPQGEPGKNGEDYVLTDEDKQEITNVLDEKYETYLDIITPKSSAKGKLVHITDALPLPTFENKIDGNVEQETTKGNQLFNKDLFNDFNEVIKFVTLQLKPNTDYTLSSDIPASNETVANVFIITSSGSPTTANNGVLPNNPRTITSLDDGIIRIGYRDNDGKLSDEKNKYWYMLNEGNTALPYEKFTNGASPNPEYPQEIEVLEGYNLLPTIKGITQTINGVTFIKNNDGTITANGTAGSGGLNYYINGYDYTTFDKGTYTLSDGIGLNSGESSNKFFTFLDGAPNNNSTISLPTFTLDETTDMRARIVVRENVTLNNVVFKPQIVKGTEAKPYLPYGCVGYKVNGKNIVGQLEHTKLLMGANGVITNYTDSYTITKETKDIDYITCSGDYSLISDGAIRVGYTNEYPTINGTGVRVANNLGGKNPTLKIDKNYKYVTLFVLVAYTYTIDEIKDKFQIELGDKATPYEPYQEQIVYLDLKGNWVGATKDTKDLLCTDKKKLWLVKNTKIKEYTSENVRIVTTSTYDNIDYARIYKPDDYIGNGSYSNNGIICDKAYWDGTWYDFPDTTNIGRIVLTADRSSFWIGFPKGTTEEEMKEKLSNFKILYPTKEPEIIELGELPEPIKTFEGVNNIQLLANLDTEIEVKYALDVKKYYDNKLAEISAQII